MNKISSNLQTLVIALMIIIAISAVPVPVNALQAFPGAEGFGSETIGGRGGTVCKVTRLADDSNPGSLRYCLTRSYPRIVIFTTGGTITLSSEIYISNPYITIAGQTAPGDGIQIKGYGIRPESHDIIIRGLRIRPGPGGGSNADVIGIEGTNPYNIIIDHNSLGWVDDEVTNVWSVEANNITYSWNIIHEALTRIEGGYAALYGTGYNRVTSHHNLLASNRERNPLICQTSDNGGAEIYNNVIYNYGCCTATTVLGISSIIGNVYIENQVKGNKPITVSNGGCTEQNPVQGRLSSGKVYVSHNIGYGRPTDTGDDWLIVNGSQTYRANSSPFAQSNATIDAVSSVKTKVLNGAGATAPHRDSNDTRVVNDVINLTGNNSNALPPTNWPTLAAGTPPTDTDGDGIPDAWESAHGLNPNNGSDAGGYASSGYTWIEEYINSFFLADSNVSPPPALLPMPPPALLPMPPMNIFVQ